MGHSTSDPPELFDVDALVALRRVAAFDVHPDGTWLAVAAGEHDVETGQYRSSLWRVPTDGGEATRLLDGPFADSAPCFRRDGALGLLSNRHPDGSTKRPEKGARLQLWLLDGDTARPVTDAPLGVTAFRFAQHADRLVYVAPVLNSVPVADQRALADDRKKRGPSVVHYRDLPVRHWDTWLTEAAPHLFTADASGADAVDLTPDANRAYRDTQFDLSADGRTLAATHAHPGAHRLRVSAVASFDLVGGSTSRLGETPDLDWSSPCLSPDGQRLAATRRQWVVGEHGPHPLWVGDPDGQGAPWHDGIDLWLQPLRWLGSDALLCAADVDGDRALFRVTTDSLERLTGPGSYGPIAPAGGPFAIRHGTVRPPEVVRLDAGATQVSQLAGVLPQTLAAAVTVDVQATAAGDGARVPWRLVRPANATGPLPTLLWIHGGPISQWGDQWHWRWNAMVMAAAGWQVVLPNPRGSTGLGQAHVEGIWGNTWGGRCFDDLMELTDDLEADPRVDATRMVAMGGSFGGYMTNWIGTQTDRYAALVTHASLFSFSMFYGTTDMPAYWALMLGADPWTDREALERYSPDRHVAGWRTPTLVIHGDKDYRVPISEGLYLFEALRRHDVEAELMVFPDENHWVLKPRNIGVWYRSVLDFLHRHAPERG